LVRIEASLNGLQMACDSRPWKARATMAPIDGIDSARPTTMNDPSEPELDVALLRAFRALLDEASVTRAAVRLGLSQSSMSARLSRLRKAFGDPLFVAIQGGRGLAPTPLAERVAPELGEVLDRLERLPRLAAPFEPSSASRSFTLALPDMPAAVIAPALTRRLAMRAPGVRLAFVAPQAAAQGLERGAVDLLLAGREALAPELIQRPLWRDAFLTASGTRIYEAQGLDLDAFCAAEHLVVGERLEGFESHVDRALAVLGRKRRVTRLVQSYGLAPGILTGQDLLCTLPAKFLRLHATTLCLHAPPLALEPLALHAAWHPKSSADPGHAWLRAELFQLMRDEA